MAEKTCFRETPIRCHITVEDNFVDYSAGCPTSINVSCQEGILVRKTASIADT